MDRTTCSTCGTEIGPEAPQGLCPACLFQAGLRAPSHTSIEIRCGECRSLLAEDARFCAHCGTRVPVASSSAADAVRAALEETLRDSTGWCASSDAGAWARCTWRGT